MCNLGWEREESVEMFLGELGAEAYDVILSSGGLVVGLGGHVYSIGEES